MNETTLEQYFIEDYKRLKEENDELKARVSQYEANAGNHDYGITDLHQRYQAVRGSSTSSYYLKKELSDGYATVDEWEEWLALSDAALFEKLEGTYLKCTYSEPYIEFEEHEFQYTLFVKESRTELTVFSDGKQDSQLMKDYDDVCMKEWIRASLKDQLIEVIMSCIREDMQEAIDDYKADLAKEDGDE